MMSAFFSVLPTQDSPPMILMRWRGTTLNTFELESENTSIVYSGALIFSWVMDSPYLRLSANNSGSVSALAAELPPCPFRAFTKTGNRVTSSIFCGTEKLFETQKSQNANLSWHNLTHSESGMATNIPCSAKNSLCSEKNGNSPSLVGTTRPI